MSIVLADGEVLAPTRVRLPTTVDQAVGDLLPQKLRLTRHFHRTVGLQAAERIGLRLRAVQRIQSVQLNQNLLAVVDRMAADLLWDVTRLLADANELEVAIDLAGADRDAPLLGIVQLEIHDRLEAYPTAIV